MLVYQDKDGVPLCGTEGGVVVGCHGVGSSVMSLLSLVVVKVMCWYEQGCWAEEWVVDE